MFTGKPTADFMPLLKDPSVNEIAERMKATVGQVLVSWAIQRQTSVIPKSEREERIKQNIQVG